MPSILLSGESPARLERAALARAAEIVCRGHENPAACSACRRIREGTHPDVFQVEPDGAQIPVDRVREAIRFGSGRPYEGRGRVAWIRDADQLNSAGANALLKSLEEPGEALTWILTTAYPEALLPTILSRCQHEKAAAATPEAARRRWVEKGLSGNDASEAAAIGLDPDSDIDWTSAADLRREIAAQLGSGSMTGLLRTARILEEAPEAVPILASLLRDTVAIAAGAPDAVRQPSIATLLRQIGSRYGLEALRRGALEADQLARDLERPLNKRLACERVLLRLRS